MNPLSLPDVALPLAASGQTSQPPDGPRCPFGPCGGKGWYYRFDENRYRFVVNCLCRDPQRRLDLLQASGMPARFFGATLTRPNVEIFFKVEADPALAAGISQVANQGRVHGANFPAILTDDPRTPEPSDPTVDILGAPLGVPTLGPVAMALLASMLGVAGLLKMPRGGGCHV